MPTLGRYQTTDEIASSGPFTVYAASEGSGGGARFAIKTLRTVDEFADPEILERQAKAFVRAAELQKSLGVASPARWAPIHEIGKTAEGVYYVTDLAQTAQRLVDSRKSLAARDLGAVITGVAEGLIALRDAHGGRGHGRLRAGNVLLGGEGRGQFEARLIDPAAESRDAPAGEDIKALGGLLFELVAHRPAPFGTEIRTGPEWSSLGGPGEPLRQLCEQLINPTAGAQTLTLEEVIAAVESALATKDPRAAMPGWLKASAAVIVLGCVGGGAWWFTRPPPAPPPKPALANHFSETLTLRDELVRSIEGAERSLLALVARSDEMGPLKAEFEAAINADRRSLEKLRADAGSLWEAGIREWEAVADPDCCEQERAQLIARQEALSALVKAGVSAAARFEGALRLAPLGKTVEDALARAETASQRIPMRQVEGENTTALEALRARLGAIREDAQKLSAAPGLVLTPAEGEAPDAGSLIALAERRSAEAESLRGELDEFRRGLPGAQALSRAIERMRTEWRGGGAGISVELRDLGELFFQVAEDEFGSRDDGSEQALQSAWTDVRGWIQRWHDSYGSVVVTPVPARGGEAAGAARVLVDTVRAQTIDGAIRAAERAEQFRDAKLPMFMEQREVLDSSLRAGQERLAALAGTISSHLETVESLEARLGQGWRWEEADAQGQTLSQRTQALREAVESLEREPAMSEQRLQREAAAYAGAVRASLSRVLSVEEVSRLSGAQELLGILARAGEEGLPLSSVMQAWAGLARIDTFPTTLADTQRIISLGEQSRTRAIAGVADSARRESLDRTVLQASAAAWRTLVNQRLDVARAGDVFAAYDPSLMMAVGVDPESPSGLSAPAMYNFHRVRLVERIEQVRGDADQQRPQLMALANGFSAAVNGIEGVSALRDDQRFSRAARRIGFIEAGKSNDPTSSGPAMRGWSASGPENFASVVYTSPDGGTSLAFIRLDSEDAEAPRYLATSEVTVGLMARVVSGLGQEAARITCLSGMLQRGAGSAGSDNRDGPRSWVWADNQILPAGHPRDALSVAASNGWIGLKPGLQTWPGDYPFYPPGVAAPAPPSAASPVNHVPVVSAVYVAALLGCRLPDEEEWTRAVGLAPGGAARRGPAWKQHLDYTENWGPNGQAVRLQARTWEAVRPYSGIFLPPADEARLKTDMGHDPSAQGGVWFEPVRENAPMFEHLTGNMSEWLCNDVNGAIALVGDGGAPADAGAVNQFVSRNRDTFRVVGGSALSPPGLEVRTAYPASSTQQRQGASDVGFRLAFTVTGGGLRGANPAQKVAEDLRKLDFMPVAGR
jgi:hypothetical protein